MNYVFETEGVAQNLPPSVIPVSDSISSHTMDQREWNRNLRMLCRTLAATTLMVVTTTKIYILDT